MGKPIYKPTKNWENIGIGISMGFIGGLNGNFSGMYCWDLGSGTGIT